MLPKSDDVEEILRFGSFLTNDANGSETAHLLVHCHMGISRSTAAMAILMAQSNPEQSEERIFSQLLELRPQAWPNSLMVEFADTLLGRRGRLLAALADLYAQQLAKRPETEQFMRTHGRSREVDLARRP
jgi:predicted protein tyrosine phosphatase